MLGTDEAKFVSIYINMLSGQKASTKDNGKSVVRVIFVVQKRAILLMYQKQGLFFC